MDNHISTISQAEARFQPPHLNGLEALHHLPRFASPADGMLRIGVGAAVENLSRAQIAQTKIMSPDASDQVFK